MKETEEIYSYDLYVLKKIMFQVRECLVLKEERKWIRKGKGNNK